MYSYEKKIVGDELAMNLARGYRALGRNLVTTNGCFDLIHVAHLHLLEEAKRKGDYLFVLLNSDASIKRYKGDNRPFVNERGRAELLAGLECVDYVTIFNEDAPLDILEKIRPHYHVKGGSYIAERVRAEEELLKQWGGKLICLPLEEGLSTTSLANAVAERNGKKDI